jgi:hypothetical protein
MPEKRPADLVRPLVAGPEEGPEPPYPIHLHGPVIKGFGRGSREVSRTCLFALPFHIISMDDSHAWRGFYRSSRE